jgi:hypothetical protein
MMANPSYIRITREYEAVLALALESLSAMPEDMIDCVAVVALTTKGDRLTHFWNASTNDKLAMAGALNMEATVEVMQDEVRNIIEEGEDDSDA